MTALEFQQRTTPQQAMNSMGLPEFDLDGQPMYWDVSVYDYQRGQRTDIYLTGSAGIEWFYNEQLSKYPDLRAFSEKGTGKNNTINFVLIILIMIAAYFIFFKK